MATKNPPGRLSNIRKVLDRADKTDIDEGRVSYFRYHEVLRNLAAFYGVDFPAAVAVFAALSPNNDYEGNLRSAVSVLKGFREGVEVERVRVACYLACRDRAYSYLTGTDFLGTVKGPKIRSFYANILNPMDPFPVTIDGHAVNIWRGRPVNLRTVASQHWNYNDVATAYRHTAGRVGLLPNQLQAITWFTWKRIHNIVYAGRQLHLFEDRTADLWRTLRDPESIIPFEPFSEPRFSTSKPPGRIPEAKEQTNEKTL